MRNKIFLGILVTLLGFALNSCSDKDDYSVATGTLLSDGSVTTGVFDVTATTATMNGSVAGLDNASTSSYTVGFYYGSDKDNLSTKVTATSGTSFSYTISGLVDNTTLYYQAYVTLQGRLTYTGEVKTLVTTEAEVITSDAEDINAYGAILNGSVTNATEDATGGFVIYNKDDIDEMVEKGLHVTASNVSTLNYTKYDLMNGQTYYYAAYLDLVSCKLYGNVKSFTTSSLETDVDEEFVDLGLSVKWAKHNVGAAEEYSMGGHFGFGEITGTMATLDPTDYASADIYKTANDIAYQATGGKATLPTADQFEELFASCTQERVTEGGAVYIKLTGPNGNYIYLPAAGYRVGSDVINDDMGVYMTGNINSGSSDYAIAYTFDEGARRQTLATYTGMSVRPVSTAKNVKFDKSLLYTKWYLDNGQTGKQLVFKGPVTQYRVSDTWGTVTNGEPNPDRSNDPWEMGANDGWIGYTYGTDYGYMEFLEDGTFFVHRIAEDGTVSDETGTFTVDEVNKTVTVSIPVICGTTWLANTSGTRNILSLTEYGLQIGLTGTDDYQYAFNYYSQKAKEDNEGVKVKLLAVGSDWQGTWGAELATLSPDELDGTHTSTYYGSINGAMIVTLDAAGLKTRYPNAFVRIDDIKLDGTSIAFDANKFFYGDIEGNGNFRVELFNIYGKGANNGAVVESPFSNATNVGSDPAFTCSSSIEVTYTIYTDGAYGTYTPQLITINPSWGGTWGYDEGATFTLSLNSETAKYEITENTFDITYKSDAHSEGSIMTFAQIDNLYKYLPTLHSELNYIKLDGNEVSFDASKVVDSNEDPKYRLELWNMYGITSQNGCGFGTPSESGVISELAFSSSMELNFTIKNLFKVPTFE